MFIQNTKNQLEWKDERKNKIHYMYEIINYSIEMMNKTTKTTIRKTCGHIPLISRLPYSIKFICRKHLPLLLLLTYICWFFSADTISPNFYKSSTAYIYNTYKINMKTYGMMDHTQAGSNRLVN